MTLQYLCCLVVGIDCVFSLPIQIYKKSYWTAPGIGRGGCLSKILKFYVIVFYMMSKVLSCLISCEQPGLVMIDHQKMKATKDQLIFHSFLLEKNNFGQVLFLRSKEDVSRMPINLFLNVLVIFVAPALARCDIGMRFSVRQSVCPSVFPSTIVDPSIEVHSNDFFS